MNQRLTLRENAAIKAAFDQDLDRLGGVTVAETKCRADKARLSRYASISDQNLTTHVPVDVMIELMRAIIQRGGTPETLHVMADQCGFKLVPRAEAEAVDAAPITKHLGDITRATGNLMTTIAEALPGGIDPDEQFAIDVAASAVETEIAELRRDTGAAKVVPIKSNDRGVA